MESLQKINNQQLLQELQARVVNKKISQKELAEILIKSHKLVQEKELAQAYEEWANDPNEWKDIKEKY
ncbi:hypothetical protein [endosymbiont DhMRE of Dentiscutata heterogama]|uniref:hypothetical protein n=1 Tax=endosymbiont DhMRE of Dentiscutata heterogama TaxID=1609546 RepID=UPI002AD326FD|nr:hypothetical protein [endosymbiont DhMRE of Dentiscutata heterogama]